MRNYFLLLCAILFAIALACQSASVKDVADPNVAFVSASNQKLAQFPVAGFGYKSSKVPPQSWDSWARNAAPVIKEVINNLPDGYVLQVTGHTDASGPEDPTGNKPGNIKISSDRAKSVYDALQRQGVTSPKMTYKGVGSAEPVEGVPPRDPSQRRVTFKVISK